MINLRDLDETDKYDYKLKAKIVINQYKNKLHDCKQNNQEYVYPNQLNCAEKIIKSLLEDNLKIITLVSLPQVGKTGTLCACMTLAATYGNDDKNYEKKIKLPYLLFF